MSAPTAALVHLDDLPTAGNVEEGEPHWRPVRHTLGVQAFGVNAWTVARAGDRVIERHDEVPSEDDPPGHQELYLVVRGRATFRIGDEALDAPAGTLVFIADPATVREAVAETDDTAVVVVGAAAGEAFTPSPWERRWLS
jgi:quercetin dioxygenase-like cupin family protein